MWTNLMAFGTCTIFGAFSLGEPVEEASRAAIGILVVDAHTAHARNPAASARLTLVVGGADGPEHNGARGDVDRVTHGRGGAATGPLRRGESQARSHMRMKCSTLSSRFAASTRMTPWSRASRSASRSGSCAIVARPFSWK